MNQFVTLFKRFERFWHWCQALLIFSLIMSGLEVHGFFTLLGFELAVFVHDVCAFAWSVLLLLIFTWIATTGEWRQYVPSFDGVIETVRFYSFGVFKGEKHPHHTTPEDKFNPLQRLGYLGIVFGLLPLQAVTGLIFYFFPELKAAGVITHIEWVALIHTLCAYILISFLVIHLYMITFGATLTAHLKAMITGKEKIHHDSHSEGDTQ